VTRCNDAGVAYWDGLKDRIYTVLQFVILFGHAQLRGFESR